MAEQQQPTTPTFSLLNKPFPDTTSLSPDERRHDWPRSAEREDQEPHGGWSSSSSTLASDIERLHQTAGKPRARQGFISCNLCRSRKVKCPGEKPSCSMCVKKGIQCHYDTRLRRRGPDRLPGARVLKNINGEGHDIEYAQDAQKRREIEAYLAKRQKIMGYGHGRHTSTGQAPSYPHHRRAKPDALQLPPPPAPRSPPTSIARYHFEYEPTPEERRAAGLGIGRLLDGAKVNGIRLPPLRMILSGEPY